MLNYPESKKIEMEYQLHGMTLTDNYEWLAESSDPEVIKWVTEQNKFTAGYIKQIERRDNISKRMRELSRYDSISTPILCRKSKTRFIMRKSKNEDKQVVFMINEDGTEREFINMNRYKSDESLDIFEPSWDGKYVALGISQAGNENPKIIIMKTENKEILDDTLYADRPSVIEWLPDSTGFYYSGFPREGEVSKDEHFYWNSVYYHRLFSKKNDDKKIFSHSDVKEYYHNVKVASDNNHLIYYRSNFGENEAYFSEIGADKELKAVACGFKAEYRLDIMDGKAIIKTNEDNPRGIIYVSEIDKLDRDNWRILIKPSEDEIILYFTLIAGKIFLISMINAHTVIKIFSMEGIFLKEIPLPFMGSASITGEWDNDEIYLSFTSFNTPKSIYRYNIDKNALSPYFTPQIKNFDPDSFCIKQVFFESADKTRVSMFLVFKKTLGKGIHHPVLVTGYGGFGIPILPEFSAFNALWVEAGGILAVVNLRGGGEYGEEWHQLGKRDRKQNVFDDLIAAVSWLAEAGYTRPELTAIKGGSNGGLLVGAVLVQRPDLVQAVLCGVPLLDMVNYHKYGIGEIWKCEYGISTSENDYRYLIEYSPYQNIDPNISYPSVMFTAGGNDARVHPVHARKMAAALQSISNNRGIVLYREIERGGHGGSANLTDSIEDTTDTLAFLINEIGSDNFDKTIFS